MFGNPADVEVLCDVSCFWQDWRDGFGMAGGTSSSIPLAESKL